jgi:hypothetical protein
MKARIISSVAAAGVLALVVSCSQDDSRGISAPTEASLAKTPAPPSCSFSTAGNDAKAYFASNKDSVYTLLNAMQSAYKGTAPAVAATPAGFAVLTRLAAATDAGLIKSTATPAIGSKFANDVLLCMSVAGYVNTEPVDFSLALGAGGLFAVRDGSSTAAVVSRTSDQFGPLYGAEPNPTGSNWPLAGQTLFYGWQVSTEVLAGDGVSGNVFELRTLPNNLTFSPPIRAGVCFADDENARILHLHANEATILPPAGAPGFCTPQVGSMIRGGSPFAVAVRTLESWLTPKPAFAAPPSLVKGGGGLVTGLSEIGPVEFIASIAFVSNIPNAARSDTSKTLDSDTTTTQFTPVVRVRATSQAGGNPLAGVTINLTVIGNQGSFIAKNTSAVTGSDGVANFYDLSINKAGGYTVTASAPEFGSTTTATSNLFNISGQ